MSDAENYLVSLRRDLDIQEVGEITDSESRESPQRVEGSQQAKG